MLPTEQNENKTAPTQRDLYLQALQGQAVTLSSEESARLEALKAQDPDAWRRDMNQHEKAFQDTKMKEYDEAQTREAEARTAMSIKEKAEKALNDFNTAHQTDLTPDMLEFDVPPRLKSAYTDHNSEEYLLAAKEYLLSAKIIEDSTPPAGNLGGKPQAVGTGDFVATTDIYEDFGS